MVADTPAEIARVPEDNTVLLLLWALDNWTTGLLTRLASLVLYGVAGAIGWLSGHPVRRWAAITLATAYVAWITAT